MLAERDLLRKVWKKAAMPIIERDQPMGTRISRSGDVLRKKSVRRTKAPRRKKTRMVMKQRPKLKMKYTSQ